MAERIYAAIDLKSFYASVECVDRGLDPLNTNLVVADKSRTEKTICLAVSPSLKSYGIPGRARLFEVVEKVKQVNAQRRCVSPGGEQYVRVYDNRQIQVNPTLALDYIVAPPRMARYEEVSTQVYQVYLRYIAPEDIHVYSIDEVFIDLTGYLETYQKTPRELVMTMIRDVLHTTGITATAGIGTNLYLAKIAMDITAKKMQPDSDGVRIAELDEMSYRRELWEHRPLTDFWRVGRGYAKKLESVGLYTMGDIARCSIGKATEYYNEDLLYKLFGINAELLIDHAWGWEPCEIAEIKAYRPESNSVSSGQVLQCAYSAEKGKLVVREMTELLLLDLVKKGLYTDQIVLTVGYDIENMNADYRGEVMTDHYGRKAPKYAHGTVNLGEWTTSSKLALEKVTMLYDQIVNPKLLVRRLNVTANHVLTEEQKAEAAGAEQLDLFAAPKDRTAERKERRLQEAVISLQDKYGKNAVLKGMNLEDGATAKQRNQQIGGHKA